MLNGVYQKSKFILKGTQNPKEEDIYTFEDIKNNWIPQQLICNFIETDDKEILHYQNAVVEYIIDDNFEFYYPETYTECEEIEDDIKYQEYIDKMLE